MDLVRATRLGYVAAEAKDFRPPPPPYVVAMYITHLLRSLPKKLGLQYIHPYAAANLLRVRLVCIFIKLF